MPTDERPELELVSIRQNSWKSKMSAIYSLAYWVILHTLLSYAVLFIKINIFKKFFQEYDQSVNQFKS